MPDKPAKAQPSDLVLANKALAYSEALRDFALAVAAGHGDMERTTYAGQRLASVREFVAAAVDAFEALPAFKDLIKAMNAEKTVVMRTRIHDLFLVAKDLCSKVKRPQIEAAFNDEMNSLLADEPPVFSNKASAAAKQFLSEILDDRHAAPSPSEAAEKTTLLIVARHGATANSVSPDGAPKALRKQNVRATVSLRDCETHGDAPPDGPLYTLWKKYSGHKPT